MSVQPPSVKGNQVNGLIRQTGDTVTQLPDGTWQAEVIYICRWANLMQLAPRRNAAAHPDFPGFLCNGCRVTRLKPGIMAELRVGYRGFLGTNWSTDYGTQELVSGTSEQPIETHPKFVSDIAGRPSAPLNGALFLDETGAKTTDDTKGIFKGFAALVGGAKNKYAGVTSFLCPSTVYRKTTPFGSFPASVSDVGFISSAPVSAGSGRNWLFTSRTCSQSGGVFSVSEEYMLSGPDGWDTLLYSA
jgi:hypothetical protein